MLEDGYRLLKESETWKVRIVFYSNEDLSSWIGFFRTQSQIYNQTINNQIKLSTL
jgi:hypothetical protein